MTKRMKTREQRAKDDLEVATRVAKRTAAKMIRLKGEYDQALADSTEADRQVAFLKTNPFLPAPPPEPAARRPRAPRTTPPPVDRIVDGVVVEKAATT